MSQRRRRSGTLYGYRNASRFAVHCLCVLDVVVGARKHPLMGSLELTRDRVVPSGDSGGLGREALTTLVAAGREDCAAGAGAHAQAEAVLLAAEAVVRLESPLGHVEHSMTSVRASSVVPWGSNGMDALYHVYNRALTRTNRNVFGPFGQCIVRYSGAPFGHAA